MEVKIEKAENGYIVYSYTSKNWNDQDEVIRVAYTFNEVVEMLIKEFNVTT